MERELETQFRQISCQTAVADAAFGVGVKDFNFNIGSNTAFNPSKSYFKIEVELSYAAGVTEEQKTVALSDNPLGSLFDNVYFKGGGQDISSITSYAGQGSILRQRLTRGKGWLDSMGKDAFLLDSSYDSRLNKASAGTNIGEAGLQKLNLGSSTNRSDYTIQVNPDGSLLGVNTNFDGTSNPDVPTSGTVRPAVPLLNVGDRIEVNTPAGKTQVKVTSVTSPVDATCEPSVVLGKSLNRVQQGYAAVHTLAYAPATGVVTFGINGGAALPVVFALGDFISLNFLTPAVAGVVLDKWAKVTAIGAAGASVTVAANSFGTVAVAASATNEWYKIAATSVPSQLGIHALRGEIGTKVLKYSGIWRPPIGAFDISKMGAGDYRLSLNPNSRYKTACVESVSNLTAATYDFNVKTMELYIALSRDDMPQSGVESLLLSEQQMQSKPISSTSGNYDFTVQPSTNMIAFFIQSGKAGNDTRVPSSKFKMLQGYDMSVKSFQLTYANRSRPSTRWPSEFTSTTNSIQQRYYDSFSECGLADSPAGCETLADFINRGCIYVLRFDKASDDKSTMVQLQLDMNNFEEGSNLIMCSFYTRVVEIGYANGMITQIQALNV
jgi:hypothetical protein